MSIHIEHVIALNDDNKYREERGGSDIRLYNSEERRDAYVARKRGERVNDEED